ncbi:hypothetical protein LOC67_09310 [Stieleria sp. JC731]|uniref:hypothetical protein n=1 Tax=Pirellulaceae TaxID=2691357 RepID=UPI001E45A5EC|nr:hypothetical protein [Stieleria sp. JC731]MCC9600761.1 hypothetical protein [Stieleria sp. JC731]
MAKTPKQLKAQIASTESLVITLRESLAEIERQLADHQYAAAGVLAKATWPAVVFAVHRRLTGSTKSQMRTTTGLINGLATANRLTPMLIEKAREADIAAVMGDVNATTAQSVLTVSLAILDASESATVLRRPATPKATTAKDRRPMFARLSTAAAALFAFAR